MQHLLGGRCYSTSLVCPDALHSYYSLEVVNKMKMPISWMRKLRPAITMSSKVTHNYLVMATIQDLGCVALGITLLKTPDR